MANDTDTMIDKEKIPETTYNELVDLFGVEAAEKIILKHKYNYQAITQIIMGENLIKYLRLGNFRTWLKKNLGLSMRALLIILVIVGFILYIFLPY